MKKRRMKLMAILLTICMSASTFSVGAAGMEGIPAVSQEGLEMEELNAQENQALDGGFEAEGDSGVILNEEAKDSGFAPEETEPTEEPDIEEGEDAFQDMMEASVTTVKLGTDVVWKEVNTGVPADTVNKKLYRTATDKYFTKADGMVRVQVTSTEAYTYIFDENGFIDTGVVPIGENEYFFILHNMVEESSTDTCPQTGRMQTDYWVLGETSHGPGWVYYGDDGAKTKAPDMAQDIYVKGDEVKWEYASFITGKIPYRLFWISPSGKASRYFTNLDGLVNIKDSVQAKETKTYAFDEHGMMLEGYQKVEDKDYYFLTREDVQVSDLNPEKCNVGTMVTDKWILSEDGKSWRYFGADGAQVSKTGYQAINGAHYYLDKDGKILTGSIEVDGVTRYFNPNSTPIGQEKAVDSKEGWIQEGNAWKYVNADGSIEIRTGFQKVISGNIDEWYYLDEDGVPMTNVQKKYEKNGRYYYFGADGTRTENKWVTISGRKYYFTNSGARATYKNQWATINGKKYYFGSFSAWVKRTGWQRIGRYWYYFSSNGNLYTDRFLSLTENGTKNKYYVNKRGAMLTGMQEIGGYLYYFKRSQGTAKSTKYGYCLLNRWVKTNNKWYRSGANGRMVKGWINLAGKEYYLGNDYILVTNQWITNKKGVRGYLDADGLFNGPGWVNYKGKWRYLSEATSGSEGWATGWTRINGYKYLFRDNGDMVTDLSSMAGFTGGPYLYDVNRSTCTVTVLGRDENGNYTVPVIAFACSVGLPGTPTPTGSSFGMSRAGRWQLLMGPSYGQYATHVDGAGQGGIFFHSVAGSAPNHYALNPVEYNRLGSPASHGCIRLCVRDAKWIWDHWGNGGNRARILDRSGNIFYKPSIPKIGPTIHYDPTDPAL
ncbi:MAG: L,D-transpeptidase family protein [Blautia sp.]